MKQIKPNIYVENELSACSNSYVVTGEGVVVIDTPMLPANAKKLAAEMAKYGPVRYVINGEPHTDHIAGNCYYGGTVIAHEGTRQIMMQADAKTFEEQLRRMAPESLPLDKDFRYRLPEITLTESLTLYLGDHTFRLMHMPGHTPYNLAVYVPEERTVFTSDNINLGMPIFISAVLDEWLASLDRLEELDVDTVVPGHGDVCGREAFSQMRKNLRDWIDTATAAIKRGVGPEETVQEILRSDLLKDVPKEGPMQDFLYGNIQSLYNILSKSADK